MITKRWNGSAFVADYPQVNIAAIIASGTPSSSNFLRGDGTWNPPAIGNVSDATTVGQNLVKLSNPSAITFLRINANNTVSALNASDFRDAIGAGAGGFQATYTPQIIKPSNTEWIGNLIAPTLTAASIGANTCVIAPFVSPYAFSIDQWGTSVSTAASGGTISILIFDADSNGRPTTKLKESGALYTDTTGTKTEGVSGGFSFTAGKVYWIGIWCSHSTGIRVGQGYSAAPQTWTTDATPVGENTLSRTQTFSQGNASNWTYAASQHGSTNVPLVIMRISG